MAVTLHIKVVPSSGRLEWKLDKSGILKCFLTSQPEKNKANNELIKFIARSLDISANAVLLVGGLTSRTKRVTIASPLTAAEIIAKLTTHS